MCRILSYSQLWEWNKKFVFSYKAFIACFPCKSRWTISLHYNNRMKIIFSLCINQYEFLSLIIYIIFIVISVEFLFPYSLKYVIPCSTYFNFITLANLNKTSQGWATWREQTIFRISRILLICFLKYPSLLKKYLRY